ncbi:MAG: DNA-binding transcriptional LysR family regulator [Myxococcota bacterium]|jgi:DNA-binding transcriptional LysR family regulator
MVSMDWNDVRYFLALARLGSVRAAGTSLGVSHSTVARRVEALEARLVARLFDRNRDGYSLTEAGDQMLPVAQRVEREMAALERGIVGQDERLAGTVSLTCCDSYIADFMLNELRSFCDQYPEIELAVNSDSRAFDLSKREADIAIRTIGTTGQPPEHLIGTKLAPLFVASYFAPAHAERVDPDREGSSPRWLSFEERKFHCTIIAQSSYPNVPPWGVFSSLNVLVGAATAGYGIVMLPTYAGDREPELRRLQKPDISYMADLWLLSHPDLRDNARLKATRAAVIASFKKHSAMFGGQLSACGASVP